MTNITNYPRQDKFKTTLAQDLDSTSTTAFITLAPNFSLSSGQQCDIEIDYDSTSKYERVTLQGPYTGGNITLSNLLRGQPRYSGGGSTASEHSAGAKVIIGPTYADIERIAQSLSTKIDTTGGIFTGPFSVPAYANASARDAAITSPVNGMEVYLITEGRFEDRVGGVWVTRASGAVTNASDHVSGKVDIASAAEVQAGTATDTTSGATNVIPVSLTTISSAGSGDFGKIPALNSAGKLNGGFVDLSTAQVERYIRQFTAGEAINGSTTPKAVYLKSTDGKIYQASTATTESCFKFIGVTRDNVAINAAINVIVGGTVSGFTGFTIGSDLFLTSTLGAVAQTIPTGGLIYKIGRAISATDMIIELGTKTNTGTDSFLKQADASNTVNNDTFIDVGFSPQYIDIDFWIQGHDSPSNTNQYLASVGNIRLFQGKIINSTYNGNANNSFDFAANSFMNPLQSGPTNLNGVTAGVPSGTNAIQIALSVLNVTQTGFTIRRTTVCNLASTSNARAIIVWRAHS